MHVINTVNFFRTWKTKLRFGVFKPAQSTITIAPKKLRQLKMQINQHVHRAR